MPAFEVMVRGHKNWYVECEAPPGKIGQYIKCPHCLKPTSRKNINKHLTSIRCMSFDVNEEHEIFDGKYSQRAVLPTLDSIIVETEHTSTKQKNIIQDNYYVWGSVYNSIIEYKLIYPLYQKLLHF